MKFPTTMLLALAAMASPLGAATPSDPAPEPINRTISADLHKVQGPMSRMAEFCVGAGRANEGLRADWQRQLTQAHQQLGFRYIRFHGLFCDDMGVYFEDKHGNPEYNWQYIDQLFDFLHRIGMKPFVELGFMPSALASGHQTIFWWHGNVTPPKDMKKWVGLVSAFVQHCRERYGDAEVRSWYFEVWNEPNLSGFFAGTQAQYFQLYEATARAIKAIDPELKVGGPATAGCGWIQDMIDFCAKNHVPIDFISTHEYATMSGFLDADGSAGTIFSPDRNAITESVLRVRNIIRHSALPNLELHFTEWSSSYTPHDPIHDTYQSAPFILDKMKHIGDAANSMSYWTFTDIFEEAGPRRTPFHGGFGMLNYEDIAKPSYYAYKFLHRLGPIQLACPDDESFVCADHRGGVQALFWDFTICKPNPPANDQVYYLKDIPPARTGTAKLELSGLAPGRYSLALRKVGYRVNDAFATYRDLGSPSQLTRAQVDFIRKVDNGAPLLREMVTVGADGRFDRSFELRENDVCLVTLEPL
ncbi:beta-xylosidase [mine drainage metagenome]|uniref:Beta-xylosidase n=1 Tax=mine drainage metagenome TaxID=410659 RepID=A0A1J5SZG0_9ZZZZ